MTSSNGHVGHHGDDKDGNDDATAGDRPAGDDVEWAQELAAQVLDGVDDVDVYSSLARVQLKLDDPAAAVATLDRGLRFAGIAVPLLILRGTALREAGRPAEALEAFDWAVDLDPTVDQARLEAANCLGELRQFNRCLERLDAVLAHDPGNAQALFSKAEALRLLERLDEARVVTERLLELAPDEIMLHRQYTYILQRAQRADEALIAADRWVRLAPRQADAHLARAEILVALGRSLDAADAYDQAIACDPELTDAPMGKAFLLDDLEMERDARLAMQLELVDAALRADPSLPDALRWRGLLLWMSGRNTEALDALELAAGVQEPDGWLLTMFGAVHLALGNWAAAAEAYDGVVAAGGLERCEPEHLVGYGTALRLVRRLDDAKKAFDLALQRNPDDVETRVERAEVLRLQLDDEGALAELDQAIADGSRSAFALGRRGQVLSALGRSDEAVGALEEALAASAAEAWIHAAYGEALRNVGEFEHAIEAFDQALALDPDDRFTRNLRCETIRQSGDATQALALAEALLLEDPDDTFTVGTRVAALVDLRRYEQALALIRPELERSPDYTFGSMLEAQALSGLDRHTEALKAVDAALDGAADVSLMNHRALILLEQGRAGDALAYIEGIESGVEDAGLQFYRGQALVRLGRAEEAIDVFDDALRNEQWLALYSELADAHALAGHVDRALELRKEAIALLPEAHSPSPEDLASAAWSSFNLGDLDAAIRHYLRSTSQDPYVIEWQFDLALAEFVAGQRSVAVEQLTSWRTLVGARPDGSRAAGIVSAARETFRRARLFGMLSTLPEQAWVAIDGALHDEELAHPVVTEETKGRRNA